MYRTNEKVNASIEAVLISAPSTLTLKAENEKLKADNTIMNNLLKAIAWGIEKIAYTK